LVLQIFQASIQSNNLGWVRPEVTPSQANIADILSILTPIPMTCFILDNSGTNFIFRKQVPYCCSPDRTSPGSDHIQSLQVSMSLPVNLDFIDSTACSVQSDRDAKGNKPARHGRIKATAA
jgi:hypothetical protein